MSDASKITIRAMLPGDRAEWLRMRRALWPDCPAERHELEMRQLAGSPGVILVAEHRKRLLCGFMEVSIRNDQVDGASATPVAYVEGWYVDPEFRGSGIGRKLLEGAEQWAASRGFAELASDAELDNGESIGAHISCGFTETCRAVHFIKRLAVRTENSAVKHQG